MQPIMVLRENEEKKGTNSMKKNIFMKKTFPSLEKWREGTYEFNAAQIDGERCLSRAYARAAKTRWPTAATSMTSALPFGGTYDLTDGGAGVFFQNT